MLQSSAFTNQCVLILIFEPNMHGEKKKKSETQHYSFTSFIGTFSFEDSYLTVFKVFKNISNEESLIIFQLFPVANQGEIQALNTRKAILRQRECYPDAQQSSTITIPFSLICLVLQQTGGTSVAALKMVFWHLGGSMHQHPVW